MVSVYLDLIRGSVLEYGLILGIVLVLMPLVVGPLRLVIRRIRRVSGTTRAALLVVMVVALVLRLGIDPFRPLVLFDEYQYAEVSRFLLVHHRGLFCAYGDVADCRLPWGAASSQGYPMLMAFATALVGPWGGGEWVSLVAGVLTVPALFALGIYLLRDEGAALAASALLAILPLHIRYATARSSDVTSVFLAVVYVLLLMVHRRQRSRRALGASVAVLALAATVRPENVLLSPPLLWALAGGDSRRLALAVGAVGVLVILVAPTHWANFGGTTLRNLELTSRWWAYKDHHGPVLFILALMGAACVRGRGERWFLGYWFAVFCVLFMLTDLYLAEGDQDRHMLPSYPSFLLLAGAGTAHLARRRPWAAALLGLILLWQLPSLYEHCQGCDRTVALEPTFARDVRRLVGKECWVATQLPFFVNNAWERRVVHVSLADEIGEFVRNDTCLYYYENAFCDETHLYQFPERAQWCRRMHVDYVLRKVHEVPDAEYPLALYEVVGSREASSPKPV